MEKESHEAEQLAGGSKERQETEGGDQPSEKASEIFEEAVGSVGASTMLSGRCLFKGKDFSALKKYVGEHKIVPSNIYTSQLGKYKAYVGFDEKRQEEYISYYDIWDIDPPELKTLGVNVDQFNFPYEIYGRIYKSDCNKFLRSQQN